jgi:D-beta-D-heptose 7-phosphate kinase/D-beta-D-heptose 1-phosphate adenosyltransferase
MSAGAHALAALLDGLPRPRVLVVGDLMLDHYVFGRVERISPEAPIQILKVEREEQKPGGAGSVAAMLRRLEAEVALVGAAGRDPAGDDLVSALEALGCDTSGIVRAPGRPTTRKTRCIANVQHVLRVDREVDAAYEASVEAEMLAHLRRLLEAADIVLLSDYGKGVLKGRLAPETAALARAAGKQAIVDPKPRQTDWRLYRGVTAVTPNRAETEAMTGIAPRDPDSYRRAGEALVRALDLEAAAITLDRDGIYLFPREGEPAHLPTEARAVYDVTGAGDMVLSMLGLARAAQVGWADALRLANAAAGLEVTRVGVAPLSRGEIRAAILGHEGGFEGKIVPLERFVRETLPELRRKGKKIAFTNGCFDLLHVGHVKLFQFARAHADLLVVGLNSDRSVRELKGPGRPLVGEEDRAHVLAALAAVDHVIVFDEPTPLRMIEAIVPDVLVKAEDYRTKAVVGRSVVEAAGGKVLLAPLVGGVSTTDILRRGGVAEDEQAARAARAAAEQVYAAVEARAAAAAGAAGSNGGSDAGDGAGGHERSS